MNETVNDFLSRAAARCGFVRESYLEKLTPSAYDKISIIPFFGDLLGELVFPTLLFRRLLESELSDRYVIVVTHPGRSFLYPEANEVWGVSGDEVYDDLFSGADGLKANTARSNYFYQALNRFFPRVHDMGVISNWYNRGLTGKYLDSFGKIVVDWPPVVGSKPEVLRQIGERAGTKVFMAASKKIHLVDRGGRDTKIFAPKAFYVFLAKSLIDAGFHPVFWNGPDCYDVSGDLPGRVGIITDRSLSGAVAAARSCGFVLNTFNDIFSVGILARVPYLMVEERKRYFALNLFEIEDIMETSSPKPYFSFAGSIPENNYRETALAIAAKTIQVRDEGFSQPGLNVIQSSQEADYGKVRRRRANKLGFRLFNPPKIED